jgi:molybdate transport system substrate-binding protein
MNTLTRKYLAELIVAAFVSLAAVASAAAAELTIWTSRAIATVLDVVGPQFERETGNRLKVVTGFSPDFVKRSDAGERFDILVSPPPALDGMIKAGKLDAGTRTLLVRTDVGVEVRAGAPKPDIGTVAAFKQALLAAKSIAYLPAPGVPQMLERIGVAEAIRGKTTIPATDIVSELVAKGEVELGIVVITQILTTPGVELVGPLPSELKVTTTFGGAVSAGSNAPEAARALLKFLQGEESRKVIRKQGMEPVS